MNIALKIKKDSAKVISMNPANIPVAIANRLLIKSHSLSKLIKLENMLCFKADGNYTTLITIDGQQHLFCKTLKYFEDKLSRHSSFYRVHHSYLINVDYLSAVKGGSFIKMKHVDELIPIARRRRKHFIQQMQNKSI